MLDSHLAAVVFFSELKRAFQFRRQADPPNRIFFSRHVKLDVSTKIRLCETVRCADCAKSVESLFSYKFSQEIALGSPRRFQNNFPGTKFSDLRETLTNHPFDQEIRNDHPVQWRRAVASLNSTGRAIAKLHYEHDSRLRRNDRDVYRLLFACVRE